ncbi:MAG: hypothetical protein J6W73_04265 [Verrucomicrobia bacterium]|nr:hypothetical protein [Verrucomicrobiota bacterium]
MSLKSVTVLLCCGAILCGCASSTIEKRRAERITAYETLSPEYQQLVDAGEIKTGMPKDAVYIAWGKPDDITYSEDSHGKLETWLYYGRYMKEYRYWNYRAINRGDGEEYLVRHLESDYNPESFLKAELIFSRGKLISWRTYPTPQD